MTLEKIVAFGDSFVWGDELLDPRLAQNIAAHPVMQDNTIYRESHCFLGLLGANYSRPTENFGWPGASLQSMIWTYLWWMQNESVPLDRCLVLVGLTESWRMSFFNPRHTGHGNDPPWNRFKHATWFTDQSNDKDWTDMYKRYLLLTDCTALHRLNLLQALLFFHGQRQQHSALFQFKTMASVETGREDLLLWPESDLASTLKKFGTDRMLCQKGHPNEQGHRLIADRLIAEIDRVI